MCLPCCFCKHGKLAPEHWDFKKKRKLTPVFDISVPNKWVAAMKYKCKCCEKLVEGNNGN
jgi:transposase